MENAAIPTLGAPQLETTLQTENDTNGAVLGIGNSNVNDLCSLWSCRHLGCDVVIGVTGQIEMREHVHSATRLEPAPVITYALMRERLRTST